MDFNTYLLAVNHPATSHLHKKQTYAYLLPCYVFNEDSNTRIFFRPECITPYTYNKVKLFKNLHIVHKTGNFQRYRDTAQK
jgi:hypothetical protein